MKTNNKKTVFLKSYVFTILLLLIPFILSAQGETDKQNGLAFLIWGPGEPTYCEAGTIGSFNDGDLISLKTAKASYDYEKDMFTIEMKLKGKVTKHSFIDNIAMAKGQSPWLIADPSGTDNAPSFTNKFLLELAKLPKGKHKIDITFLVNNKKTQEGSLNFNSDGKNLKYKLLIPKFVNPNDTRDKANTEFQKELEEKEKKEEELVKQSEKANYFQVTISNMNSGYTMYIIAIDQKTLSETVYEVLPKNSKTIDLYRGKSYQLKAYNQNELKSDARNVKLVDQKMDKLTIKVK
jgi:hypothetical protein